MILHLLDSIVNWKKLMLLTPNNKKYHYKQYIINLPNGVI